MGSPSIRTTRSDTPPRATPRPSSRRRPAPLPHLPLVPPQVSVLSLHALFLTAGSACSADLGMMKPPESVNTATCPITHQTVHREQWPSHLRGFRTRSQRWYRSLVAYRPSSGRRVQCGRLQQAETPASLSTITQSSPFMVHVPRFGLPQPDAEHAVQTLPTAVVAVALPAQPWPHPLKLAVPTARVPSHQFVPAEHAFLQQTP